MNTALTLALLELGVDAARAILHAVDAGDTDAVKQLAAVLHPVHQLALEDAALIASQRAKAGS